MILQCPQCATRYTVDGSKFPPAGRNVRCAKCGNVWHQAAPEEVLAAAAPAAVAPEPIPEPAVAAPAPPPPQPAAEQTMPASLFANVPPPRDPEPPRRSTYVAPVIEDEPDVGEENESVAPAPRARRRSPVMTIVGWAGLIATILIIGWAAVNFRQNITTLWPKTASLYSTLGMEVNPRGIAFTDVAYHREVQDGQAVLAVTGKLVNVGNTDMPVPEILVALSDNEKRELYHWSFAASVSTLHPGEAVPFLTRLSSPPAGAKHLEVRFAGGE